MLYFLSTLVIITTVSLMLFMYLLVLVCKEAVLLHSTYDNKHTFVCCEQYPCQIWYFSVFAWHNTANFIPILQKNGILKENKIFCRVK